jgi:glucose-1-phosphate thymidylyltransferase
MDHMLNNGLKFYTDQVQEWLDCGNKDATVYTNARILDIKKDTESLVATSATLENSTLIAPCFIGENVVVKNSVIGPNVSLEAGAVIEDSRISNSIVQAQSLVKNMVLTNSLIGKNVNYTEKPRELSLGDFSTQS